MKQITLWFVGGIALLCVIAFGISVQTRASERERWEYQSMISHTGSAFNNLGNEGWELVAVTATENPNQSWYYFKRKR